jgi:hypothetical protein
MHRAKAHDTNREEREEFFLVHDVYSFVGMIRKISKIT